MRTRNFTALLLACASISACNNDALGTGVPRDTVLDEATSEELNDLCVGVSNELLSLATGPLARTVCTAAGVLLDSVLVACDDIRDTCLDESEPPEVLSCNEINTEAFDSCDTTVGELETCLEQLRANVVSLDVQVSCSMTRSELAMVNTDDVYPALCTEISEECPALGMLLQFDVALDSTAD